MKQDLGFARLMEARYQILHEEVSKLLEYGDHATIEKACILISKGADFERVKKRLANGELIYY